MGSPRHRFVTAVLALLPFACAGAEGDDALETSARPTPGADGGPSPGGIPPEASSEGLGSFMHAPSLGTAASNPTEEETRALEQSLGGSSVAARLHGCTKLTYAALEDSLRSRGVNVDNRAAGSAGALLRDGKGALGVANYASRVPEATSASTAAMAKQGDIFAAAAPEIIANLDKSSACPGVTLLAGDQFTRDGLTCIMGKPATDNHVVLANRMVKDASDPKLGTTLVVAALLQAAHSCE